MFRLVTRRLVTRGLLFVLLGACEAKPAPAETDDSDSEPRKRRSSPAAEGSSSRLGMPLGEIHIAAREDGGYDVTEDTLLQVIAMGQAGQLPIAPAIGGHRVASAPAGSVVAMAGLQPDDLVTAINGVPVDDAALLAKAYPQVKVAKAVTLTITRKGETVSLVYKIGRKRPAPPTSGNRTPIPALDLEDVEGRISKKADDSYEIKRSLADDILASPMSLARTMRIVPLSDGGGGGLRVYGIRSTSPASLIGLKNGDTVRAVNGKPIGSPEDLMELYAEAKGEVLFKVEIERKGEKLTLTYRVVD